MKVRHSFAFVLLISLSGLCAQDPKPFPDCAKAFPTEKLFTQTKMGSFETYAYATDFDFAELKKKFREFLGEGWTEEEIDPEVNKAASEAMKAQGKVMEGNVLFSNPVFPDVRIGLTQIRMEIEGKKFMASIAVIRTPAELSGAGQSSPRPGVGSEAGDKPSPEAEGPSP